MGYPETDAEAQVYFAAFRNSLRRLGWIEGRNIKTDTRWATPADAISLHRFAKELVALQPDLILSHTTPTTAALLQQTHSLPIVFAMIADPVGSGFVASFARPGGNATGFVVTEGTLGGKWVDLLKEVAPHVVRMAMLFNPATAPHAQFWLNSFKSAAASYSAEAIEAPVRDTSELETVIAAQAREPNTGLIVLPDSFTDSHRVEITSLAASYRIPAVYAYRFFTALGGLISYGIDLADNFRRSATYVDRILKEFSQPRTTGLVKLARSSRRWSRSQPNCRSKRRTRMCRSTSRLPTADMECASRQVTRSPRRLSPAT
jgi:putative ABC transport system substrate-binding protein